MNKVAFITGGTRGIGRQIAEDLAFKGYNIIANYNKSGKEANELKEELKNNGINIEIFKADVSNKDEVKALVDFAINKYNKIDVLINNAGIDQIKPFLDITEDDWNKIIKNNLSSVFYMCQEVLPYMINKKEGNIINISSIWGITGASCESHYSVTKAGIDALTKSLAKEMGPSNIRINSINVSFKFYVYEKKSLQIFIEKDSILHGDSLCSYSRWLAGCLCRCRGSASRIADWYN
mgnify:CR=1 FL=1